MTPINPYIILAVLGAILASFIGGGILGWHEKGLRVPALLEAQKNTDKETCDADKKLTKDTNDALQKDRDAIARKLASLKLQHPATCVPVTNPTNVLTSNGGLPGQNGKGISSDWLRNYAADAKLVQSELANCISFLVKEREIFNQEGGK